MALPTSGTLTLAQIQTEFGGSNPISLSEYYAGGANVPSGTSGTNGAVPSSGTISVWNFYGTAKVSIDPRLVFNNTGTMTVYDPNGESGLLTFTTTGTISGLPSYTAGPTAYLNPTGTGAGSGYQVRLTNISITGGGAFTFAGTSYSSGSTAWFTVSVNRSARLVYSIGASSMTATAEIKSISYSNVITRGISITTV